MSNAGAIKESRLSAGDLAGKCLASHVAIANRIGKTPVLSKIICASAGIDYRKTKVRHPRTNGMAERAIRTVKENVLKLQTYEFLESAVIGILHCQDIHNFHYQMKVLNYKILLRLR